MNGCVQNGAMFCCVPEWVQLTFSGLGAVDGVVLRGRSSPQNRLLTGVLEFIPTSGTGFSIDVVFSPTTGDWARVFPSVLSGSGTFRFKPGWANAANAGLAELELYAP